tara:strand:+ start:512 stop:1186 length:675 start_codon:yes stop_codon:yes gene_type:complete
MNAWALLYDELYGKNKMTDKNRVTPQESDEYDPIVTDNASFDITGIGSTFEYITDFSSDIHIGLTTESMNSTTYFVDPINYGEISIDTSNYPIPDMMPMDDDTVSFSIGQHGVVEENKPSIENPNVRKYEEDKTIKALQDYISTTYGGHYTSEHNNVQTLDLIESVGDAESFCRSNAIKYLSRYDKKGQGKRDLLKAMHYTALLYYFSGNTKEPEYTNTRYETF